MFCFDKVVLFDALLTFLKITTIASYIIFAQTGTLTELYLACKGVDEYSSNTQKFSGLRTSDTASNQSITTALATCHELVNDSSNTQSNSNGSNIDRAMFAASKFRFETNLPKAIYRAIVGSPTGNTFGIVKHNAFDHDRMCSSVVVEELKSRKMIAFAKGTPEAISKMCLDAPPNMDEVVRKYTKLGKYCLACATKLLPENEATLKVPNAANTECNLNFLGIIVFDV